TNSRSRRKTSSAAWTSECIAVSSRQQYNTRGGLSDTMQTRGARSQKCNEGVHGLFRTLFHQPMARPLQFDHLDIGCDTMHLRAENRGACFFSRNRQHGHG